MKFLIGPIVYAQVERNEIYVLHPQSGNEARIASESPFSTSRLAVGTLMAAQLTLMKGFKEVLPKTIVQISPVLVIQQMLFSDSGISEIEQRTLLGVGYGAGARSVYVWQGLPPTRADLLNKSFFDRKHVLLNSSWA